MTPAPTIAEQIEEVGREIRQRERVYPKWVEAGRYKAETAEKKLADMRAALASLEIIALHADGLRTLIQYLRSQAAFRSGDGWTPEAISETETQMLLDHPGVNAVLETFPGAIIADVRAIGAGPAPEQENP